MFIILKKFNYISIIVLFLPNFYLKRSFLESKPYLWLYLYNYIIRNYMNNLLILIHAIKSIKMKYFSILLFKKNIFKLIFTKNAQN